MASKNKPQCLATGAGKIIWDIFINSLTFFICKLEKNQYSLLLSLGTESTAKSSILQASPCLHFSFLNGGLTNHRGVIASTSVLKGRILAITPHIVN